MTITLLATTLISSVAALYFWGQLAITAKDLKIVKAARDKHIRDIHDFRDENTQLTERVTYLRDALDVRDDRIKAYQAALASAQQPVAPVAAVLDLASRVGHWAVKW